MKKAVHSNSREHLKKLIVVAMFTAIAYLITFVFRFNVVFLTFDLKDTVIALVSLMYGPVYGVASSLAVALIESFSVGSSTGFYGFIMNFLASATFSFIFGLIYKCKRNFKVAIISAASAAVALVFVMITANILITPLYMELMDVRNLGVAESRSVYRTDVIAMIPTLLLPFNLCKATLNASLTLMLYKPFTNLLKKIGVIKKNEDTKYKLSLRSVILFVCCFVIAVLSVLYILLMMNGEFHLFK